MAIRTIIAVTIALIVSRHELADTISPGQLTKLTKQQLLDLDSEISEYYSSNYETLDRQNVTYDEQLYRTLRAIRHTVVVDLFDYRYSDDSIRERSMGSKVDDALCKRQLAVLTKLARMHYESSQVSLPLTVTNYLESNGKVASGVLDGSVVWLGSHDSCVQAKIPAQVVGRFLDSHEEQQDIRGRYCMAHMRAKSWPKWDMYFEDRLTIRVAVCIPESCHSKIYKMDGQVRQQVDYLARRNLAEPFKDDSRYETFELYCLPDEDSPFRQFDLGAKLLMVFVLVWAGILIYTNKKYSQRREAMRRLRETIDIKMIVSEKGGYEDIDYDAADQVEVIDSLGDSRPDSPEVAKCKREYANNSLAKQCGQSKGVRLNKDESNVSFDFVQAFSIEANIDYLFRSRTKSDKTIGKMFGQTRKREPSRDQGANDGETAHVKDSSINEENTNRPHQKSSRVNLDVLDAIKVFSTMYIVLSHSFMFYFDIIDDMRLAPDKMLGAPIIIVANSLHVVQLFYIIAGVLLTFLTLSRQKRKHLIQPSFWILVIVGRYFRLMPVYFLVFWFARHVGPYTGSGPIWFDYRTDHEGSRGYCSTESWTTMLTLSSADIKLPLGCLPQTWYLSNDFRTLLVLPIYIITLAMNYKAGYALIAGSYAYSSWKTIYELRKADIDYQTLLKWQPHTYKTLLDRLEPLYKDSAIRLGTYMLSIITGHLLYLYETRQIKAWPSWFKNWVIKISLLFASTLFFAAPILASPKINQFLPKPDNLDGATIVLLIPIFRTVMEVVMCVTLLSIMTGGGSKWLRDSFSSRPFKIMSNLSYIVFLIHIEMIFKFNLQKTMSNWFLLWGMASFFVITCYVIALFLHILFEMPINNVLRIVFKRALLFFR